jgi:hypothetical protein
MESFVATDFDNNTRLVILSMIIISALHCMYIQQDAHDTEFILSDNFPKWFGRHHHLAQEHNTTLTTASDNRYTVLLAAALLESLEQSWAHLCVAFATQNTLKTFPNLPR